MNKGFLASLCAGLAYTDLVVGQACQTSTLATDIPNNGAQLALQSISYCGGTLNASAYIANLAYNKLVNLYYTNKQNVSTPLSNVGFNYQGPAPNHSGAWEIWFLSVPAYVDGITYLLNLTYQDTDHGNTYVQQIHLPVNASGPPAPTPAAPPAPYASPTGFGSDITQWLNVTSGSQSVMSFRKMFANIDPVVPGASATSVGSIVAARSGPSYSNQNPNYQYHWVRDASLTMEVVESFYAAATNASAKTQYQNFLFEYAASRAKEQTDPNLQTGLGEPKFNLDQSVFTGPWGRPQNDGPATAAITLIEFANDYLAQGGSQQTVQQKLYDSVNYPNAAPIKKDLLFVAANWSSTSFDLWEEESSDHFYTRMVQRRALVLGSAFAQKMGDSSTASTLSSAAKSLNTSLSQFWDPNRQTLLYEYGPILRGKSSFLDVAVVLGVIHGYAGDDVFGYTNDQVLSSVLRIATSFISVYEITGNHTDFAGRTLGIPVGRYPEDVYNGYGTQTNGGNPWYLATASVAQHLYTAASQYQSSGKLTVTNTSKSFFDYFTPAAGVAVGRTYASSSSQFQSVLAGLEGWGDAFMRTVRTYAGSDGSLSEEFDRSSGVPRGATDLTWSYASLLTAASARATLRGDKTFWVSLANLGVAPNS